MQFISCLRGKARVAVLSGIEGKRFVQLVSRREAHLADVGMAQVPINKIRLEPGAAVPLGPNLKVAH